MIHLFLADVVVALHLAFVGYVVFGELLTIIGIPLRWQWIRNFWFRVSHLGCILVVAAEALLRISCPLTLLQRELLQAAGKPIDDRSFVGQMLDAVMFPGGIMNNPTVSTLVYVGFALLVLATFVIAPPRWRRKAATAKATLGLEAGGMEK